MFYEDKTIDRTSYSYRWTATCESALTSIPTTQSFWVVDGLFDSLAVVCFGLRMVVHGRYKIVKTLKDCSRPRTTL